MASPHRVDDAVEVGRFAHIRGLERASVHPSHHQRARLRMHDCRRDPGRMRRPGRGQLVHAIHPVHRNVLADAHHVALAGVLDGEVDVGDPAAERLRRDIALPARETRGSLPWIRHEMNRPSGIGVRSPARACFGPPPGAHRQSVGVDSVDGFPAQSSSRRPLGRERSRPARADHRRAMAANETRGKVHTNVRYTWYTV